MYICLASNNTDSGIIVWNEINELYLTLQDECIPEGYFKSYPKTLGDRKLRSKSLDWIQYFLIGRYL